jgi:hypothetical protein
VSSYGVTIENSAQAEFKRKWASKEERRKRNLVSDKLVKPDPSKPRNKPCACGSGLKYKMCCEKNSKEQVTATVEDTKPDTEMQAAVPPTSSGSSSRRNKSTKRQASAEVKVAAEVAPEQVALDSAKEERARKAKKASKQKLLETLAMSDAQRRSGVVAVVKAKDEVEAGNKRSRGGRRARAAREEAADKQALLQQGGESTKKRKTVDVAAALRAKKAPAAGAIASVSAPAWD